MQPSHCQMPTALPAAAHGPTNPNFPCPPGLPARLGFVSRVVVEGGLPGLIRPSRQGARHHGHQAHCIPHPLALAVALHHPLPPKSYFLWLRLMSCRGRAGQGRAGQGRQISRAGGHGVSKSQLLLPSAGLLPQPQAPTLHPPGPRAPLTQMRICSLYALRCSL